MAHAGGKSLPENVALDSSQQKEFVGKVSELKKKVKKDEGPGVIYIGHIPHGFYEPQMKEYFSQFGKVKKLRIARSKRTGNSKGYAFVQFAEPVVAKVVADTMNNYLMFHRLLKCQLVPAEKLHPETFKGSERQFKRPKAHFISIDRHNRQKTEEKHTKSLIRAKSRKARSLSKLADLGIDFEYPGLVKIVGKEVSENEPPKPLSENEASMLAEEAMEVLYDDSDEEDISFRTPPNARRKSLSMLMTPEVSQTPVEKSASKQKKTLVTLAHKNAKKGKSPSAKSKPEVQQAVNTTQTKKGPTKLGRKRKNKSNTGPAKKKK